MPAQGKRLGAIRLVGAAAWMPSTRRKLRAAFQEPSYAYGNGRAFPRSIVTSGLLTIDSVMALSRDSLMRPLTKLRARGVSIPHKLRILVRTAASSSSVGGAATAFASSNRMQIILFRVLAQRDVTRDFSTVSRLRAFHSRGHFLRV